MADLSDPVPGTPVSYYSVAAALAGAMMTLRFLVEASPRGRFGSVVSAFVFALFVGPALAELLKLTRLQNDAMMLALGFAATNLIAGAWTFLEKFRADPQAAISWLLSIVPWPRKAP